jgi:RNA polymerase primary sigma factor
LALKDTTKIVDARREKGYLTYKEVNDLILHDIHSPEDLDDLATSGTQRLDVLEGQPRLASSALDKHLKTKERSARTSNSIT